MEMYYASSEGEEVWEHTCLHSLLEEMVANDEELLNGSQITVYSGELKPNKASDYLGDLKDQISSNYYDALGEEAYGGFLLNIETTDLQKHMEDVLDKWCDKNNCHPTSGEVINIKPITVNLILDSQGTYTTYEINDGEVCNPLTTVRKTILKNSLKKSLHAGDN